MQNCRSKWPLVVASLLALAGCSSESTRPAASDGENGTNSAILLAGQVYGPEEYLTYLGVFPEVPDGDVDFRTFREFGNANAYTFGGYVFVEEEGSMKRFSVNQKLELVDGLQFSWRDYGVAQANASYTVFVSMQRAYTFAPELRLVLVWDPEAMAMTGTLPLEFPDRPAGMETFAYDGHVVGDSVIWNVVSADWDELTVYPALTLAIADANSNAPIRFVEDDRCIPGGPSRVDENGDYYVQAAANDGYFLAYADVASDARSCMLRVKAGQTQFDPDYLLDYRQLTGSYLNYAWIHLGDDQYVTRAWQPEVSLPEHADDYWDSTAFQPLLVDARAGTALPYPGLQGAKAVSSLHHRVDGISYFELSDTGYVEGGNTDVVALHPDGIVEKFHLDGFLQGIARVR